MASAAGDADFPYVDVLLALPPNETLHQFLASHGLAVPPAPEPGRTRARVVPIEVTSRGRLNLHRFDPRLQAQLERYLVRIGILHPGQTLSAQETPLAADPAEATTPEGT